MFRKINAGGTVGPSITITVDGMAVPAELGESIAAVLLRVPPFINRITPVGGHDRAPYCMMGACFDCLVEIDGHTSVRSCLAYAREGIVIRRQPRRPDPLATILANPASVTA
jgi:predicted molibdopterin-dependent oxidoreductase YjgC